MLINMGGLDIRVIIDSGATVYVVDRNMWEEPKRKKIKCESSVKKKDLYIYCSDKPLTVAVVLLLMFSSETKQCKENFLSLTKKVSLF